MATAGVMWALLTSCYILKIRKDVAKFVVCFSRDLRFKGLDLSMFFRYSGTVE